MLLPRSSVFASKVGALPLWPAVLAVWGPGDASGFHAHHTWHLVAALEGTIRVRSKRGAAPLETSAVLTRPDTLHSIDASGRQVFIVFVEPETEMGARLAAMPTEDVHVIPRRLVSVIRDILGSSRSQQDLEAAARRVVDELGVRDARPPLRHPGVLRVLRHLRAEPPQADESLIALAKIARLSPSRFMHVFTKDVGIPIRPYLRWLKLERAAAAIARSPSLAEAAHAAGFADAAHLTRSFRAMFGTTPTALRRAGPNHAKA